MYIMIIIILLYYSFIFICKRLTNSFGKISLLLFERCKFELFEKYTIKMFCLLMIHLNLWMFFFYIVIHNCHLPLFCICSFINKVEVVIKCMFTWFLSSLWSPLLHFLQKYHNIAYHHLTYVRIYKFKNSVEGYCDYLKIFDYKVKWYFYSSFCVTIHYQVFFVN